MYKLKQQAKAPIFAVARRKYNSTEYQVVSMGKGKAHKMKCYGIYREYMRRGIPARIMVASSHTGIEKDKRESGQSTWVCAQAKE